MGSNYLSSNVAYQPADYYLEPGRIIERLEREEPPTVPMDIRDDARVAISRTANIDQSDLLMESGYKARFSIIKFGTAVASYEAWILTVRAAFWSSARAHSWMGMERWPCRWIPSSIATSNYERYEQLWQKISRRLRKHNLYRGY